MKLYYNSTPGLRLSGEPVLRFGKTELHLAPSLERTPGAIVDGRLLRAHPTLDKDGRLILEGEQKVHNNRALVDLNQSALIVVELPLHDGGQLAYFLSRPERQPVRVLRMHTTQDMDLPVANLGYSSTYTYFHALVKLSEGTGIRFTETVLFEPFLAALRRWFGGNPKSRRLAHHYRYSLESGELSYKEEHRNEQINQPPIRR